MIESNLSKEEALAKVTNQYNQQSDEEYKAMPFKTMNELMADYFSDGKDGYECSIERAIPKYFYHNGRRFEIDFALLD